MKAKKQISLSDAHIQESARLFNVLSDPSRLRLIRALMNEPKTVSELVKATGMRQANVSKHLGILLSARFVGRAQEGNFARYRIVDKRLFDLCKLMCARIEDDIKKHAAEFR